MSGYIPRRKYFLHDVNKGQMTQMKGVRRRIQLLDELRNRRNYKLKEEAEGRKRWKRLFVT